MKSVHLLHTECFVQIGVVTTVASKVLLYFVDAPLPVVVVVVLGSSGGGEDLHAKVTLINRMT